MRLSVGQRFWMVKGRLQGMSVVFEKGFLFSGFFFG